MRLLSTLFTTAVPAHGLTTAFPSGVRTTPTEINEVTAPLVIWQREFAEGSGGDGKHCGGAGQRIEISHAGDQPFWISRMFDRIVHPARGRAGGGDGARGWVGLASGQALAGKGKDEIPAGERLVMITPGGGGYGVADDFSAEEAKEEAKEGAKEEAKEGAKEEAK